MSTSEINADGQVDADASDGAPRVVDVMKPARWWAVVALAVWLAAAVSWTAHIDRVTGDEGRRSSIDWIFLTPCALVAALAGAIQAGPKARWWGAILVVAILLTTICLMATFVGTPRDWWHVGG